MITDIDLVIEQIQCRRRQRLNYPSDVSFTATLSNAASMRRTGVPDLRPARSCTIPPGAGRAPICRLSRPTIRPITILVGKLIVHGKTRGECLMRLKRALDEFVIDGIETTLPLFRALVREKDIIDGDYHIRWLEEFLARGGMEG